MPIESSVSGSGDIKGFDLVADHADVEVSGAGLVELTVNKKLDVRVSGSGDVRYKGNASVSRNISGAGSVEKVD